MTKAWAKAALIRAARTFGQSFSVSFAVTALTLSGLLQALYTAAITASGASVLSLAMSLKGLPEVDDGGEKN